MSKNNNEGVKLPPPPKTAGKYRKASALEDGQSITGTVVGFRTEYSEKLRKDMTAIALKNGNEEFELNPAGTINDALAAGQLKIGRTYKFQKEGLEKTKKGGYKNVFGIYDLTASANTSSDEI